MKTALLLFLQALPIYPEDVNDSRKPAQLEIIAEAVSESCQGDHRLAALVISTGFIETGYSLRIHDGHCKSWECDHGRARGPWQIWRNQLSLGMWKKMRGLENTFSQATAAAYRIRIGLEQCNGSPYGAIARYVGLPCDARNPLLDERFRWYKRAYRKLQEET